MTRKKWNGPTIVWDAYYPGVLVTTRTISMGSLKTFIATVRQVSSMFSLRFSQMMVWWCTIYHGKTWKIPAKQMVGNCCLYEQLARPDPMSFLRILDALMMMRRRRNLITTKKCLLKLTAATKNNITWDTCFVFFPTRPNNFPSTQTCTKNKKNKPNKSTDQKMFWNLHSTYLMTYFS